MKLRLIKIMSVQAVLGLKLVQNPEKLIEIGIFICEILVSGSIPISPPSPWRLFGYKTDGHLIIGQSYPFFSSGKLNFRAVSLALILYKDFHQWTFSLSDNFCRVILIVTLQAINGMKNVTRKGANAFFSWISSTGKIFIKKAKPLQFFLCLGSLRPKCDT